MSITWRLNSEYWPPKSHFSASRHPLLFLFQVEPSWLLQLWETSSFQTNFFLEHLYACTYITIYTSKESKFAAISSIELWDNCSAILTIKAWPLLLGPSIKRVSTIVSVAATLPMKFFLVNIEEGGSQPPAVLFSSLSQKNAGMKTSVWKKPFLPLQVH